MSSLDTITSTAPISTTSSLIPFSIELVQARIGASTVLSPDDAKILLTEAKKVRPFELLPFWLRTRIGDERFSFLFPEYTEHGQNETSIQVAKMLSVSTRSSKHRTDESLSGMLRPLLGTVEKLVLSARNLFPDSPRYRLSYIRYLLTTATACVAIVLGYHLLDIHPELFTSEKTNVSETRTASRTTTMPPKTQTTTPSKTQSQNTPSSPTNGSENTNNSASIDKRLSTLEDEVQKILVIIQTKPNTPSTENTDYRQMRNDTMAIKNQLPDIKKLS